MQKITVLFYWNTSCMFCSFRPTSSDIKRPVVLGHCPCLNRSRRDVCMNPKTVDCSKKVQSCNARAFELQTGCSDCYKALLSAMQNCRRCGPLPGLCSLRNLSCVWLQGSQKICLSWQRSYDLWFFFKPIPPTSSVMIDQSGQYQLAEQGMLRGRNRCDFLISHI